MRLFINLYGDDGMRFLVVVSIVLLSICFTDSDVRAAEVSGSAEPVSEWYCPKSHPIKGNINKKRKTWIYHMPGGSFYNKTKPEKCYATEQDAVAGGFRKSKR